MQNRNTSISGNSMGDQAFGRTRADCAKRSELAPFAPFARLAVALPLTLLATLAQAQSQAAQACGNTTVLHVASDGLATNGGTAWSDATSLFRALEIANADLVATNCYEVRLKQGVYKPVLPTVDVLKVAPGPNLGFQINRPLQLKGGYTGSSEDEREIDKPEKTVLSGDVDDNDVVDANNITAAVQLIVDPATSALIGATGVVGTNSLAVVSIGYAPTADAASFDVFRPDASDAAYTLIEGLTITGAGIPPTSGEGQSTSGNGLGAILCAINQIKFLPEVECSPALNNVQVSGNLGLVGGGMSGGLNTTESKFSPVISNSVFSGNAAQFGGAIGTGSATSMRVTNTVFADNTALTGGGAITIVGLAKDPMNVSISASKFERNSSSADTQFPYGGGAVLVVSQGGKIGVAINNSSFSGNSAITGGAYSSFAAGGTVSTVVEASTFDGNSANWSGGAITNVNLAKSQSGSASSSLTINNATFNANTVDGTLVPEVDRWLFGGLSLGNGGAILNWAQGDGVISEVDIKNSTLAGNTAKTRGGAITNQTSSGAISNLKLGSSIVWGNTQTGAGADDALAAIDNVMVEVSAQTLTVVGKTVITDPASATNPFTIANNIIQDTTLVGNLKTDPKLGPLQDNGSPASTSAFAPKLLTMLPGSGGSAIDAVDCSISGVSVDERGITRPTGSQCDMGAVEVQQRSLTVRVLPADSGGGVVSATAGPAPTNAEELIANCGAAAGSAQCSANYAEANPSSKVTLTATAADGYRFAGWSGSCSGTAPTCEVTMDASKSAVANFSKSTGSALTPAGDLVGIELSNSTCSLLPGHPVISAAPVIGAPDAHTFPFGQLAFTATGCQVGAPATITLTLPASAALPANAKMFKMVGQQWVPWSAEFTSNSVQFSVTDSTSAASAATTGDNDPTPGVISDPVLIAVPAVAPPVVTNATPVPTLSQWALMLLGTLLAGLTLPALRRNKQR